MLLVKMLVVDLMRPAYGQDVPVFPVAQESETLMNDDIVNKEISQAVQRDPDAYIQAYILVDDACNVAVSAGNGKNKEEGIVLFKEAVMPLVMIAVKIPQEAMHHELVGEPCNKLHEPECCKEHEQVKQHIFLREIQMYKEQREN
jgi:hypothetical protein